MYSIILSRSTQEQSQTQSGVHGTISSTGNGTFSVLLDGADSLHDCQVGQPIEVNANGVTHIEFEGDYHGGIQSMDLTMLDVSAITDFSELFRNGFNTDSQTGLQQIKLISDDGENYFNTQSATTMFHMFAGLGDLGSLDLSKFDTSNVTRFDSMFDNDIKLKSLDLSSFDVSKATTLNRMFYGCRDLKTVNMSGWQLQSSATVQGMFDGISHFECVFLTDDNHYDYDEATAQKILMELNRGDQATNGLNTWILADSYQNTTTWETTYCKCIIRNPRPW